MFSRTVTDHWFRGLPEGSEPSPAGSLRVVVDATLPANRRLMLLEPVGSGGIVSATPEVAGQLGLVDGATVEAAALASSASEAGIALNGADDLFYFPHGEHAGLQAEPAGPGVRQLTADDAELFAAFVAEAPADDLDEAFVEIDHWLVFGAVVDGRLVCAASMYPWSGTQLADLGVITLPAFRGRGLGRQTVRAMSAHALSLGYEPQYRCQLDNHPSVALAGSAGLARFATWDVVEDDD